MSATLTPPSEPARVTQLRRDGVSIIRPTGRLDADLADEIRHLALEARAPVVVDLDDCVLIDPAAVLRIVSGWEFFRPEMCVVSSRPGARQLLQRAGVDAELAVFPSVDHAMDDRADPTTGDRWLPARPGAA